MRSTAVAKQFAEKLGLGTSGAKALTENKELIAALKRCATQNQSFSANCKAELIFETTWRCG
jgi:hypothetical protein